MRCCYQKGERVLPVLCFVGAWVKEGGYLPPSSQWSHYSVPGKAGHTPVQISCRRGTHFPERVPGVCGMSPEDTRTAKAWFLETLRLA